MRQLWISQYLTNRPKNVIKPGIEPERDKTGTEEDPHRNPATNLDKNQSTTKNTVLEKKKKGSGSGHGRG